MNGSASRARRRAVVLCYAIILAGPAHAVAQAAGSTDAPPPVQIQGFTRGPALVPLAPALGVLNRLTAESPRTRVRLPVSIVLDEHRLTIVDACLGQPGDPTATRLRLDDGALGIGLADRARDLCAAGRPCVLRLVGYWRGTADRVGRLDVRRVDGLAPENEVAVIEIEAKERW